MKLFFTLTIFISVYSYASDDCNFVRLDRNGGSMQNVKPTNQKTRGICYAVTAEAMYDAYRLKKNPKAKLSSAHHAALLQEVEMSKKNVEKIKESGG